MNSFDFDGDDTLAEQTYTDDDALDPLVEHFYDTFGRFGAQEK